MRRGEGPRTALPPAMGRRRWRTANPVEADEKGKEANRRSKAQQDQGVLRERSEASIRPREGPLDLFASLRRKRGQHRL